MTSVLRHSGNEGRAEDIRLGVLDRLEADDPGIDVPVGVQDNSIFPTVGRSVAGVVRYPDDVSADLLDSCDAIDVDSGATPKSTIPCTNSNVGLPLAQPEREWSVPHSVENATLNLEPRSAPFPHAVLTNLRSAAVQFRAPSPDPARSGGTGSAQAGAPSRHLNERSETTRSGNTRGKPCWSISGTRMRFGSAA
jgi:hypothetical protein